MNLSIIYRRSSVIYRRGCSALPSQKTETRNIKLNRRVHEHLVVHASKAVNISLNKRNRLVDSYIAEYELKQLPVNVNPVQKKVRSMTALSEVNP